MHVLHVTSTLEVSGYLHLFYFLFWLLKLQLFSNATIKCLKNNQVQLSLPHFCIQTRNVTLVPFALEEDIPNIKI